MATAILAQGAFVPSMPTWALYLDNHVGIDIPLSAAGRPFTIAGRVLDSGNNVVREFAETGVNEPVFRKSLPPLSPGAYRLSVTIIDRGGRFVVLDRFPPLTAPER